MGKKISYKVSSRQQWFPLYKHCICFTIIWLEFVCLHVYRVILEDRWSFRTVYQGGFSCLASPLGVMAVERRESLAFTHGSPPSLIGSWQRYRVSCSTCCTHYWNKEYLHHLPHFLLLVKPRSLDKPFTFHSPNSRVLRESRAHMSWAS